MSAEQFTKSDKHTIGVALAVLRERHSDNKYIIAECDRLATLVGSEWYVKYVIGKEATP